MTEREQLRASLADRYTVERELGGGGMSLVFLARETALGRPVVVKMLTPDLAAGVSAERFIREIATAARLQQANIVPLLSSGDADGIPWYSMPYVGGESLRAKLAADQPISLTESVHILRDVARALAFAHGEGIAHRDIKPENILLSGGAAVVTDFGIAKALSASRTEDGNRSSSSITQTGVAIGTPAYMAPEQVAGDPNVDHRVDIYAWGLVAWELIAGRHPFAKCTTSATMYIAHMSETPASLTTMRRDVSPGLATLVARCVEKDPAKRPQSAAEILVALDTVGASGGTIAPARAARTMSRVVLAAIGLAVVAGGAWAALRGRTTAPASTGSKSLAVLPFESVGGDTANAYFAEGIADELTNALAKVSGLRVASTSSAFSYRNKTADPREVGKALNVGAVLQGRVERVGARMRVSVQLTNAADGLLLWTNSYQREVKDVFAVQDELTHDIVGALRMTLAGGSPSTTGSGSTTDVDTYDLFLRGLFFVNQRGPGVAKSIGYFQRAIDRDSTFARAWGELALAYTVLPLYSPVPADSSIALARRAITNAKRLDPNSPSAYTAEGFVDMLGSNWDGAVASFEHAIRLDSTYAVANRGDVTALSQAGRVDDAMAQAERATRLDPLSPTTHAVAAMIVLAAGRRDEALAMARRAAELDSPPSSFPRLVYALAEYVSGNVDSTRKLLVGATTAPQTGPWFGYLLAATGDRAGTAAFLREIESERGRNAFANLAETWVSLGQGDTTRALAALERAQKAREPIGFTDQFGMPAYDAIRGSARFAAVVKAYGLDPARYVRR